MTEHDDAIDRFLDSLMQGLTPDESHLDPGSAEAARRLVRAGSGPLPGSAFVDQLESQLIESDPVRMYLREIGRVPLLTGLREVELAAAMERGDYLTATIRTLSADSATAPDGAAIAWAVYDAFKTNWMTVRTLYLAAHPGDDPLPPKPVVLRSLIPMTQVSEAAISASAKSLGITTDQQEDSLRLRNVEWELLPSAVQSLIRETEEWPDDDVVYAMLAEQGDRLLRRWDDQIASGLRAKVALTEANLRLVVSVAKKYVGRGMSMLDLIQEGNLGLIRAVEKFQHHKGFKFSTYATWWIRQAITRAIADQARTIRIPVHMVETINRLIRTSRRLQQELGREPTTEEIAEAMEITADRVREIIKISQEPVSLEMPIGEEEDSNLGDFIEDHKAPAPADAASRQMLKEQMDDVLSSLSEREKDVLIMRFGLEDGRSRTLEEVGKHFGVTRERIRQIEAKALRKLRHPSRANNWMLHSYIGPLSDSIQIDLYDVSFSPPEAEFPANKPITVTVTNHGANPHSFTIERLGISLKLHPGQSETVTLNADAGSYPFLTDLPNNGDRPVVGILWAIDRSGIATPLSLSLV